MNFQRTLAIFAAIGGFLSFSILDTIVKKLSQWYAPVFIGTNLRICGTILVLFVLILRSMSMRSLSPFHMKHPHSHIIRGLMLAVISFAFTHGFSTLPLSTGYSIIFLLPIFTAICGAIFLKEHISKFSVLGIIIGFLGILIVLRPGIAPFSWGYVSFFMGVAFEAPFFIMTRYYHKNENPFSVLIYTSILSTAVLLAASFISGIPFTLLHSNHVFFFLAGGVFYLLAQILIIYSLSKLNAHISITMQYTQIVWGALFGFIFFQETEAFNIFFIAGVILIIGGSYTVATNKLPFTQLFTSTRKKKRNYTNGKLY